MQVDRRFDSLAPDVNERAGCSFLSGANEEDAIGNVSNNGVSLEGLSSFEKELYIEIETLFEDAYKNMLTTSVHITQSAMNLMEEDETFRAEIIEALSGHVWDNATDGVTPYHGVIEITEDGVKLTTNTVSNYDTSSVKSMKQDYANSQASGAFLTYGIDADYSDDSSSISSFISAVYNKDEETTYADLWVQQSQFSNYTNAVSSAFSKLSN